ncbi:MAG: NAD(+) synthase [Lachnospiraceae bacterium]|nr:NAD(+) synthase [Lachnospiraceae bacterium]
MKNGFVRVACAGLETKLADTEKNAESIIGLMEEAGRKHIKVMVFPELAITGYTCGDLFFQDTLIKGAEDALKTIVEKSASIDGIFAVGLPVLYNGKLYNCAAVFSRGEILGIVPKMFLPNDHEFYERRQFTPGFFEVDEIEIAGQRTLIGAAQLFSTESVRGLTIGVEICEDLWVACPPSIKQALSGATMILNLSASNEVAGKSDYRRELVSGQSGRLYTSYLYASSGAGESTSDLVFSGHNIIASNGRVLKEGHLRENGLIFTEVDIDALLSYRRGSSTFEMEVDPEFVISEFSLEKEDVELSYEIRKTPFVPNDPKSRAIRCREIFDIQARGLASRLKFIHAKNVVIGISGGLDSTLALLVVRRAFEILGLEKSGIKAITMPGFGTTDRTYNNACKLVKEIGAELLEISIVNAVKVHFEDIGQDINNHDVTYENGQARERTQILMDYANKVGGIVIGTGDLSELALGWATYNGDHMSMYGVNASVPKTLVRYLVQFVADEAEGEFAEVLYDILDTPVSPELVPADENGEIAQKTEDIVGPYELHDFFLYYIVRMGFAPKKVYKLAMHAFDGTYDKETILKWLKNFYRRFFAQQFKRNCLPDGPKVGTVSLSPRGDWRMPSDAYSALWLKELEEL